MRGNDVCCYVYCSSHISTSLFSGSFSSVDMLQELTVVVGCGPCAPVIRFIVQAWRTRV